MDRIGHRYRHTSVRGSLCWRPWVTVCCRPLHAPSGRPRLLWALLAVYALERADRTLVGALSPPLSRPPSRSPLPWTRSGWTSSGPTCAGRSESIRTLVLTAFEGSAPLAFGALADHLVGGGQLGLEHAFLVTLPAVALSGLLIAAAVPFYARETLAEERLDTQST